jgi:membrane-bound metal-dependent hydrolase YbcI (DUF457 family)
MASPVGHSLSGLGLYLLAGAGRGGRLFPAGDSAVVLLLSNLPDLDLLPGVLMGDSSLWHHLVTHSLFFALALSGCIMAAAVLIKGARGPGMRWAGLGGALVVLHILLDYYTADSRPPYGLRMFWPLSEGYYIARRTILDSVVRGPWSPDLPGIWLRIAAKEALIFGAFFLAALGIRKRWQTTR